MRVSRRVWREVSEKSTGTRISCHPWVARWLTESTGQGALRSTRARVVPATRSGWPRLRWAPRMIMSASRSWASRMISA